MWLLLWIFILVFVIACGLFWFRVVRPSLGYRMEGPP